MEFFFFEVTLNWHVAVEQVEGYCFGRNRLLTPASVPFREHEDSKFIRNVITYHQNTQSRIGPLILTSI
jgi:hypothetical protein